MVPPVLPCVDIRDVQLYEGDLDSQESVSDRNRRVREACGVEDDSVRSIDSSSLNSIDNLAFPVAVELLE